ncbi:MAG: kelch repeat-containing protein [Clostridium sp.]|uniref:kelch repeat-containing protein n=1 Tax=Clostridium sp. TaxID=1506 RepID=UPI0029082B5C|nr:kelch repeat-containing protein [Clostridium sp.]MDU7338621.1 kelch repeat-containing protein [Clostridium sp.]
MKLNMKRGLVFLLILTLMSSVIPFAFAEQSGEKWELKASMSTPRYSFCTEVINGYIYAIGGASNTVGALNSIEKYDPQSDKWTIVASMKNSRMDFCTEVINGKIYVIGGSNNEGRLASVEMYDPATNTWAAKAPLNTARNNFQTVVMNGKIYAIGGTNGDKLSSVELYDPVSDTWVQKASMLSARSNFQSEIIDNKIYVLGGGANSSLSESYDIQNNVWTAIAPMADSRSGFRSEIIDGDIYCFGGGEKSVFKYLIGNNKWESISEMSTSRYHLGTANINDKVLAIGGGLGNGYLSSVEEYDSILQTWTPKAPINVARYYFQTEIISNTVYIIGGRNSSGNLSSVEAYNVSRNSPTLTVTASSNKVKVGNRFTTTVAIHNVSNIYAEDIKIDYDAERFEYLGASAKEVLKIYKEDTSTPGSVRFIVAHLGKDSGATGDKDLIELTFRAKSVGIGKVDITKGRIADNDVLEMDVAEENCGEDTIEVEANKDVNRTGEYTLLDLGIDAYYYGLQADQTDTTRFDTDVIPDGVIDDKDLTAITQSILDNSNYPFN